MDNVQNNSIIEKCESNEAEYSDSFVGIHFHNGKFEIKFPLGFNPINLKQYVGTKEYIGYEKEYKRDILKLINILHFYKNKDKTRNADKKTFENEEKFPLYSYLYVYNWFKKYGYFIPREIVYKNGCSGKINWNRTIKQNKSLISNGNVIYLDFVLRKELYNEEEIIAKINKYCVYESYRKIGCLFSQHMPKKETIISKKIYLSVLTKRIASTFNDDHRELFINMKKILETESNESSKNDYFYGTEYFNNIWEYLVDDVYGIDKTSSEFLRPHVYWKIPGYKNREFTLKPDTIMIPDTEFTKGKIYILDAKYYKGGANLEEGNLPGGDSAIKQIVYAEKFKKNEKYKNHKIFNAFILPYDMQGKGLIEKLGETSEDWLIEEEKDPDYEYVKIQGIRMDTKRLMYNHKKASAEVFDELAKLIEETVSDSDK